jgi:phage-related protein
MAKPKFSWGQEFEDYLNSLNKKDFAKMKKLIEVIENDELLHSIKKQRVKKLQKEIYEIRLQTNEHWLRGCYFHVEGANYYITHGFNKKTNRTPKREMEKARKIRTRYILRRSDEE